MVKSLGLGNMKKKRHFPVLELEFQLDVAGLENIIDVLSPDRVIPLVALEPRPFRVEVSIQRTAL